MRIWRQIVVVSLLGAGALFASAPRGTVRSGGQSIPGATVTARQNGKTVVTTTDENGRYVFDSLPAGHWLVEVEIFGFSTARRDVDVDGQGPELEWNLELRSATPAALGGAAFMAFVVATQPSWPLIYPPAPPVVPPELQHGGVPAVVSTLPNGA